MNGNSSAAESQLVIQSGLSSGQVLQRQPSGAVARIAGTAAVDGPVFLTVTANGAALDGFNCIPAGKTKNNVFSIKIAGLPAGGPYTVTLECHYMRGGIAFATVPDIFVGDVWLLAGQSNMEGVGVLSECAESDPRIRSLTMARRWEIARDPLHFLAESPDPVHNRGDFMAPSDAARAKKKALKGGGVGLWFARTMLERTGVPQGLVATAHCGTSMDEWSPALADRGGESLYGSMLESVRCAAQPFAGVLWHQGCSDANDAICEDYTRKMIDLVAAVRSDLGQPKLPWIMAQIARETGRAWMPGAWTRIAEQQRLLPEKIPYLDVVATADLEMDDWIHISSRGHAQLAARFAEIADRLVLKKKTTRPMLQPAEVRFVSDPYSPVLEISFKNVEGSLSAAGRPLGYRLANRDGTVFNAVYQVRYSGSKARLRLITGDLAGCVLFHGYGPDTEINTHDSRGIPVPIFGPLPIRDLPPASP